MFPSTYDSLLAIVDLAPDAILVVNHQSTIVFANAQAGAMFGYPLKELFGKHVEALIPGRFHGTHRNEVGGFMASPHTRSMGEAREILALHREGREIPVDIKLSPLTLDGKQFVIAVVRDVTQFRSLENHLRQSLEALVAMNTQLVSINEEKDRLLGTAAHDLRNPLHALLMGTDALILKIQKGCGLETNLPLLLNIQMTLKYMTHLVDNLLDFAAIASGKLRLDLVPMRVEDQMEECRVLMDGVALERGVFLAIQPPSQPLPLILADAYKYVQILNNLMGNAIKFTPTGGQVKVWAEPWEEGVLLSVSDEGKGIPKERQELIFRPFERGEREPGTEKSVGLGLAIVKRIVEEHNGWIRLDSQPGAGATFQVWLPRKPGQAPG